MLHVAGEVAVFVDSVVTLAVAVVAACKYIHCIYDYACDKSDGPDDDDDDDTDADEDDAADDDDDDGTDADAAADDVAGDIVIIVNVI